MYIIYKISNKVNNKSYIGVTGQSLDLRWYQHKYLASTGKGSHLHKAIRRHGVDKFHIEAIFSGFSGRKEIEILFISEHGTFEWGYNSTRGGEDFTSSEYQRELQYTRVAQGTHPFSGGEIQRKSSKARWDNNTNSIKGLNLKRVKDGSHNFLGESNPQKKLAAQGLHHNQTRPWNNTKVKGESLRAWSIADQLYYWYVANQHKPRGGSYKAMAAAFNLRCRLQILYYKYFTKGWIPLEDPTWVKRFIQPHNV